MKIMLNPYGDNSMFIDKDLGLVLTIDSPVCTLDEANITENLKKAMSGKNVIDITPVQEPTPETEPVDEKKTKSKAKTKVKK